MKLFNIIDEFLDGKKIRRDSWKPSIWMEYHNGDARVLENELGGTKLIYASDTFTVDDLTSSDWEFYEE